MKYGSGFGRVLRPIVFGGLALVLFSGCVAPVPLRVLMYGGAEYSRTPDWKRGKILEDKTISSKYGKIEFIDDSKNGKPDYIVVREKCFGKLNENASAILDLEKEVLYIERRFHKKSDLGGKIKRIVVLDTDNSCDEIYRRDLDVRNENK